MVEIGVVAVYSAGIMIVFMLSWILLVPFKIAVKFLINSLIGGLFILIFDFFGSFTGVFLGLNEITALVTGVLGIPGFIALLAIKLVL